MTAGRKPAHANVLLLHGRAEGRDSGGRVVKQPPGFERGAPATPDWLDEFAREEWERVAPELERLNLLKPIDGPALAAYCQMVSLFREATAEVQAKGLTIENRSVKKDGTESVWYTRNPAVGVQNDAQSAIRSWCSEFGLTPSAEMKLSIAPDDDPTDDDPFA